MSWEQIKIQLYDSWLKTAINRELGLASPSAEDLKNFRIKKFRPETWVVIQSKSQVSKI